MSDIKSNTKSRLRANVIVVIVLTICLCIATYALVMVSTSMRNNTFHTGSIEINLNDGKPVIYEHEFLFEPGMTVKKDFFIESKGTWDAYYKIYFDEVKGGLANVLEISITEKDSSEVLFAGTPAELSGEQVVVTDNILRQGEKKYMTIYFHFPEGEGNSAQNMTLSFKLCADAVQTKNNPSKSFE